MKDLENNKCTNVHIYLKQVNAQTTVQMIFLDASYVLKETLGCDLEQLQNGIVFVCLVLM